MVTTSEGCVSGWSVIGVVSAGIMPGVFALLTRWCVHGDKRICVDAVGVDDVWFVFVGVGVIFLHWYRFVLLIFVRPLYGFLERFSSIVLYSVLYGWVSFLLFLLFTSDFQLALWNVWGKKLPVPMCGIHLLMVYVISTLCSPRMVVCNTMHLWPLVPKLFLFLVGWR